MVRDSLVYGFTSVTSLKVLDQLENLTPVGKRVEIEIPFVRGSLNVSRLFSYGHFY